MRILVTVAIWRDGKYYSAKCLELGVVSCGDTEEEALANIQDATLLYLNTLEDLGECEEVLKEKGVKAFEPKAETVVGPAITVPAMRPAPELHHMVFPVPATCGA